MNKKIKEFCIGLYNLKNGFFWKKGNIKLVKESKNIVLDKVRVRSTGANNRLVLEDGVRLHNVIFNISGSDNVIRIGEKCSLNDTIFSTEEDHNSILLGCGTTTTGGVMCSAIEGTKVVIGADCMISQDVYISTGDGHGIIDDAGKRTNYSCDIEIGDHVWVGYRSIINKGVNIPVNCIIGAGSMVSKALNDELSPGCVVGGNPAKLIKSKINWTRNRKDGEQ